VSDAAQPAFEIHYSQAIFKAIEDLSDVARRHGVVAGFAESLEHITRQLGSNPLAWGDPLFHYAHLNLRLYRAICGMVIVHYALNEERRVVYIRDIRPMPGSALDPNRDSASGNGAG
jgi:hypothetical protein